MKKLFTLSLLFLSILASIFLPWQANAQPPQAFKYQAVVRDNSGEILQNQDVGIRMSIHDETATGTIVYQETFFQVTNQFGLANLQIGNGTPTIGTFESIGWGSNPKFLETEIDPTGGSNFVSMGTSELLSVPYAIYSVSSGDTSVWNQNGDDIYYENGKVGIGTDSPSADLDIRSNSTTEASKIQLGNSDISSSLYLYSGNETYDPYISVSGNDALRFATYDGNFNELMRIQADGKVGIGTSSPQGEFHITKSAEWAGITFNGTGLNDLNVDYAGYSGTGETIYIAIVEKTNVNPNEFILSNDNGANWTEGIQMATSGINIGNGVYIGFDNLNEHTNGDQWSWTVSESFVDEIIVKNGKVGIGTSNPHGDLHITSPVDWDGVSFNGTGINDLSVDYGSYNATDATYYIAEVSKNDVNPNIFKWTDNNWTIEHTIEMDYSDIELSHNVIVGFDVLDGHTVGDQWSWKVNESSNDVIVKNGTIGIGTPNIDPSAILDMRSTQKGMLIPRMTQAEIATLENPANGLQAFNTDDDKLYIYISSGQTWKEVQYGSGTINSLASYTIGTGGTCANTIINGTYIPGVPLNSYNTVSLDVAVTTIGNWSISTNTLNGYSFSGSGTFTSTGTVQVTLYGTGIPTTVQTNPFTVIAANGGGTCTFHVSVSTATYTIGTGGSCTNTIINGNYYVDNALDGSNTISLEATVTTPGPWSISTDTLNGYSFIGNGIFPSTGTYQITLLGTGVPTNDQTDSFTATSNNGGGTCTFNVSVEYGPATYTIGTGGSCENNLIIGNYYGGVPLDGSNRVLIYPDVTTTGTWSISTNGSNGYSFSGSGTFTQTGNRQAYLYGTGTPINAQTNYFTATANDNNGTCTFSISVEQPHICGMPFTYGGQSYNTVQIGAQCWMAENLNYGILIQGGNEQTDNDIIEKYCYNNSNTNCITYGGLYQWNEMMKYNEYGDGICPTNWHVPSHYEWCEMENHVDIGTINCSTEWGWKGTDVGGNLKETGTSHWASPNTGATNSSGFTALPGGVSSTDGSFSNLSYSGYYWTSSQDYYIDWRPVYRKISWDDQRIYRKEGNYDRGYSVRCIWNGL